MRRRGGAQQPGRLALYVADAKSARHARGEQGAGRSETIFLLDPSRYLSCHFSCLLLELLVVRNTIGAARVDAIAREGLGTITIVLTE